jgi:endonuclease III/cell division protein FtsB
MQLQIRRDVTSALDNHLTTTMPTRIVVPNSPSRTPNVRPHLLASQFDDDSDNEFAVAPVNELAVAITQDQDEESVNLNKEEERFEDDKSTNDDEYIDNVEEYFDKALSARQRKLLNNQQNEAKHANTVSLSIKKHTGAPRVNATSETINEWKENTKLALQKESSLVDGTIAFVTIAQKKPRPYVDRLSLFFLTCSIQKLDPFEFCEVPPKLEGKVRDALEFNGWKPRKLGHFSQHLRTVVETSHECMVACWETQKADFRTKYKYKEWSLVELNDCPSLSALKLHVSAGRKLLHQIWHCFEDAESEDVRHLVIEWMLTELVSCKSPKEFDEKVKEKCRVGIIYRMKKIGLLHLVPQFAHLADPAAVEENKRQKKEAQKRKKDEAAKLKEAQSRKKAEAAKLKSTEEANKKKDEEVTIPLSNSPRKRKRNTGNNDEETKPPLEKTKESLAPLKEEPLKTEVAVEKPAAVAALRGGFDDRALLKSLNLDENMEALLRAYSLICVEQQCPQNIAHALNGVQRVSLQAIWEHHNGIEGRECDLSPPLLNLKSQHKQDYNEPGKQFACMGTDALQVLEIFLTSCGHRSVAPVRWYWEYNLMSKLELLDSEDRDLRDNAMIICLILSAATTDYGCIESTKRLHEAGFLNLKKLARSDQRTISNLIATSGIHAVKARFLIDMAIHCQQEKFGGKLPWRFVDLDEIKGIGRKTGVLQKNEAYGFDFGIGCDSHVFVLSLAWDFLRQEKGKAAVDAEDAENALREWIPRPDYKKTNKLFGTFGQLVSQDLKSVAVSGKKTELVHSVMRAMDDYIQKPYHIEMLWFMLKSARKQYGV